MNIIEQLAGRRQELGLSYRQLGEKSGIVFTHISDIENGRKKHITIDTLQTLCDALDLEIKLVPKKNKKISKNVTSLLPTK